MRSPSHFLTVSSYYSLEPRESIEPLGEDYAALVLKALVRESGFTDSFL